jgi:hypothetical protein
MAIPTSRGSATLNAILTPHYTLMPSTGQIRALAAQETSEGRG